MENKRNGWHPIGLPGLTFQVHFKEGKVHREDGPAILTFWGAEWWLEDRKVRMEDVLDTPEKREAYLLEESLGRL